QHPARGQDDEADQERGEVLDEAGEPIGEGIKAQRLGGCGGEGEEDAPEDDGAEDRRSPPRLQARDAGGEAEAGKERVEKKDRPGRDDLEEVGEQPTDEEEDEGCYDARGVGGEALGEGGAGGGEGFAEASGRRGRLDGELGKKQTHTP